MPGKRFGIPAVATVLGLSIAGLATAGEEYEGPPLTIGDTAPSIDIAHWLKGVEVTKEGFTPMTEFEPGKVYVLEFWATWCGPCKASMPHLSKLQEKYESYDVTIIGVSDEPLPTVVPFLFDTWKADGKVQNDRTQYVLATDPDRSVHTDYMKAAGRSGIPCAFIIGKDSRVEWIGHPVSMDEPLDQVVYDTWDRDTFKTTYEKEQKTKRRLSTARTNKDWATVVAITEARLQEDPKNVDLLWTKFTTLLADMNRPTEAYAFGNEVIEVAWDDSGMLNAVAWMVADDKRVETRDLEFALKAAKRANELTSSADPAILDTLARVYYEQGNFEKAIKWQRKAAEQAGDGRMGQSIREALDKYEKEARGR